MGFRNLFRPCLEGEASGGNAGAGNAGAAGGNAAGNSGGNPAGAGGNAGGTPAGGQGTTNPWFSGFKSEDVKTYVQGKNFENPESLAEAYRNLEKLRGVPQERLLTIPEKADDKAGWDAIHARLGRPEKPEGYAFDVPEGGDATFAKAAQGKFHELGLTKAQGEALAKWWNDTAAEGDKIVKAEGATNRANQVQNLKKEWGAAFEGNANEVEAVAAASGLDKELVGKIEEAIGVDGFAKMIFQMKSKFGIKVGESSFQTGQGGGGGLMTPGQAKAEREKLQSDGEFMKRWTAGGKKEQQEIDRLYNLEFPVENAS